MRYIAWFMRESNGAPFRVAKKGFKETDKNITYSAGEDKQDTYDINLKNAIRVDNNIIVMINVDTESQYSLHECKQAIGAGDYDLLITKKVIAQIVSKIRNATEPMNKEKIMMMVIAGIMGLCAGVMIGCIAYPSIFPAQIIHIAPTPTPIPTI
jgi:hypothetical protein